MAALTSASNPCRSPVTRREEKLKKRMDLWSEGQASLAALADSERRHVTAFEVLLASAQHLLEVEELDKQTVHNTLKIGVRHAQAALGEYAAIYFEDENDQGNTQD